MKLNALNKEAVCSRLGTHAIHVQAVNLNENVAVEQKLTTTTKIFSEIVGFTTGMQWTMLGACAQAAGMFLQTMNGWR